MRARRPMIDPLGECAAAESLAAGRGASARTIPILTVWAISPLNFRIREDFLRRGNGSRFRRARSPTGAIGRPRPRAGLLGGLVRRSEVLAGQENRKPISDVDRTIAANSLITWRLK